MNNNCQVMETQTQTEKNENNQVILQENSNPKNDDSTLLKTVSEIYKWIGGALLFVGVVALLAVLLNGSDNDDNYISIFASAIVGGLFTLFAGCIGEAVDDMRNSLK